MILNMHLIVGFGLKAIFADLKFTKPIQNVVRQPAPQVLARKN